MEIEACDAKDLMILLREDPYLSMHGPCRSLIPSSDELARIKGWMQYIDTRTGLTWWEPFDATKWKLERINIRGGKSPV